MREPFWMIFAGYGNVHWRAWMKQLRSLVLTGNDLVCVLSNLTFWSSFTTVKGIALSVCKTKHIVVLSTSSIRLRLSKIEIKTLLQVWTSLSQITPKCGAPGWLIFQTIFLWAKSLSNLASSQSFRNVSNSLIAPKKFVLFSLLMVFRDPRLAMNLVTVAIHDSVSNFYAPRYVILWSLGKWGGSTISSRYALET